jgi:Icc-related predicted phosphoesterase
MRVTALSDLHGFLPGRLPSCDLLLIAGDLTPLGLAPAEVRSWCEHDLRRWLKQQPADAIVGVGGNHDFVAHDEPELFRSLPWIYLEDERAVAAGVTVWGSPWALPLGGTWVWTAPESTLEQTYARISADVEIVVSHGPAHGCGDLASDGRHAGSVALRRRLDELPRLRLVVSGHIHEARGWGRSEAGWPVGERCARHDALRAGQRTDPAHARRR